MSDFPTQPVPEQEIFSMAVDQESSFMRRPRDGGRRCSG